MGEAKKGCREFFTSPVVGKEGEEASVQCWETLRGSRTGNKIWKLSDDLSRLTRKDALYIWGAQIPYIKDGSVRLPIISMHQMRKYTSLVIRKAKLIISLLKNTVFKEKKKQRDSVGNLSITCLSADEL